MKHRKGCDQKNCGVRRDLNRGREAGMVPDIHCRHVDAVCPVSGLRRSQSDESKLLKHDECVSAAGDDRRHHNRQEQPLLLAEKDDQGKNWIQLGQKCNSNNNACRKRRSLYHVHCKSKQEENKKVVVAALETKKNSRGKNGTSHHPCRRLIDVCRYKKNPNKKKTGENQAKVD